MQIANRTKDVSGIVVGRRMQIPGELSKQFLRFVDRNIDAAKQARKSVRELDELFTAGFRGAEVALVEGLIEELDQIETDTDEKQAALWEGFETIETQKIGAGKHEAFHKMIESFEKIYLQ